MGEYYVIYCKDGYTAIFEQDSLTKKYTNSGIKAKYIIDKSQINPGDPVLDIKSR